MSNYFRKGAGLYLALALTLAVLAGCQKTPDDPIVIGKDYDKMMELARSGRQTDASVKEQVGAAEAKPKLLQKIERTKLELQEAIEQKDEKIQELLTATLQKYEKELASYGEGDGLTEAPVQFTVNKDNYNEEKMYLVSDGSDGLYRSIKITNHDAFRTYELLYNVSKDAYPEKYEIYSTEAESELHFGSPLYLQHGADRNEHHQLL